MKNQQLSRARFQRTRAAMVAVMLVATLLTAGVAHAGPHPDLGGGISGIYSAWDPKNEAWANGNQKGYNEGMVVAFYVEYNLTSGDQRQFVACFEYEDGYGHYAFTDLVDFDTTFSNLPEPGGAGTIAGTSRLGGAASDTATIDYVNYLAPLAVGNPCGTDELAYEIGFTADTTGTGYIYYGGQLAVEGLTTEEGDTVGAGQGAGSWKFGTFQSYLEGVDGNKTLNFGPGDILVNEADLTVSKTCPILEGSAPPWNYTITVTNLGPGTAENVRVTDTLPNSVIYDTFSSDEPATCGAVGQVVTCDLTNPLLDTTTDPNAKWTLLIYITQGAAGQDASNVATAESSTHDPDDTNDVSIPCYAVTLVDLASFSATAEGAGIRIDWETTSEVDTVGFNLYRADSTAGERARLNASLIRGNQPPGSTLGSSYTWLDESVQAGVTYYYWLEDVNIHGGAAEHGPVSVLVPAVAVQEAAADTSLNDQPEEVAPAAPEAPPVVPEASTWVLMVSGASTLAGYVGLQVRARRRKR